MATVIRGLVSCLPTIMMVMKRKPLTKLSCLGTASTGIAQQSSGPCYLGELCPRRSCPVPQCIDHDEKDRLRSSNPGMTVRTTAHLPHQTPLIEAIHQRSRGTRCVETCPSKSRVRILSYYRKFNLLWHPRSKARVVSDSHLP